MAASCAYGRPNSTMPARPFFAVSVSSTFGKKPSTTMAATSSRVTSADRLPPIRREPAPSRVTVALSGASLESSNSLAARQRSISCDKRAADSFMPPSLPAAMRVSTRWASARSILSPPSIKWLPTLLRVSCGSPSSSKATSIRLKSVVPPPTSQSKMRRVSARSSRRVARRRCRKS
ncbi:hypothetical protein FQZ97_961200 [compost metagenome]